MPNRLRNFQARAERCGVLQLFKERRTELYKAAAALFYNDPTPVAKKVAYDTSHAKAKDEFIEQIEKLEQDLPPAEKIDPQVLRVRTLKALAAKIPARQRANREAIFQWVLNHLDIPVRKIEVGGVPSRGAVLCLLQAEMEPKFRYELMKAFMAGGVGKTTSEQAEKNMDPQDRKMCDLAEELAKFGAENSPG